MKSVPIVGRLIQLAMGAPVVGYVAYACSRGRIANVFVGQCPDLIGFCFDDVLWNSQPYLFLFLAVFYLVPASVLVLIGLGALHDTAPVETEYDREEAVRSFRRWLNSPWWLSALVIGYLLVLLASAVVRMS